MPLVSFYTLWRYQKYQRLSNVFIEYGKMPVAWNELIEEEKVI